MQKKDYKNVPEILNKVITALIIFGLIMLGLWNACTNKAFWEISIASLLTIFIAIIFSFWFVQLKGDKRKKNDKIDTLIYKIQDVIGQSDFILADTDDIIRKNLILQRSVINKIDFLKQVCSKDKNIEEKVFEIEKEFKNFREFYGDHFTDLDYMQKSKKELYNFIVKIDDKADEIHVMLI